MSTNESGSRNSTPRLTLADIKAGELYNAKETASALRLHPDTVYRLRATEQLVGISLGPRGGKTKFLGSVILAYAGIKAA